VVRFRRSSRRASRSPEEAVLKLSVIIPAYNEAATIEEVVRRVSAVELPGLEIELVAVDDASSDGTGAILERLAAEYDALRVFTHEVNRGKGAALGTGFAAATGDVLLIQDADLEYDPHEYPKLVAPILEGRADVVYGSRFAGGGAHRVLYFWHFVGNRLLTLLSNAFTNLNLSDMETCFKVFRREVLAGVTIEERRFGVEPELTAKVAAGGWRLYEVGISYHGRTYAEGKKIGWRDGVRAAWCIVKYNLRQARRRG